MLVLGHALKSKLSVFVCNWLELFFFFQKCCDFICKFAIESKFCITMIFFRFKDEYNFNKPTRSIYITLVINSLGISNTDYSWTRKQGKHNKGIITRVILSFLVGYLLFGIFPDRNTPQIARETCIRIFFFLTWLDYEK